MSAEEWRPVVGYEGLYEISDLGRVRSLDRFVMRRGGSAAGRPMRQRGRVLSPTPQSSSAHLRVKLSRDGAEWTAFVHVLVLTAFVGSRPEGMEVCHNDGDPTNNRVFNLRWDTRSANVRDAIRHGTHSMTKRTACNRGHDLVAPNLRPSQAKRGHRQCLACHRASAAGQNAARRSEPFNLQAVADSRYASIMAVS